MVSKEIKSYIDKAKEEFKVAKDNLEINSILEELIKQVLESEFASIWINEYPVMKRERKFGRLEVSLKDKHSLLYRSFMTKKPLFCNYVVSEKGYTPLVDNPDSIRIKSKILYPIVLNDNLLGIAEAYSSVKRIRYFSASDYERFKMIAPLIAEGIIKMQKNRGKDILESLNISMKDDALNQDDSLNKEATDAIKSAELLESKQEDSKQEEIKQKIDNKELALEISSIIHDIRTPANNLKGFLELLEDKIKDERLNNYILHAKNSAQMINDLTTSILDKVSSQFGSEHSTKERVNTTQYFAEIGEIFSARMYEKRIHYSIFIDPMLPKEIEIDKMRLKRVLINLIGNAIKFTPEYGSIEFAVRYKAHKQTLHISVMDSGIGIPKEKQEDIFKPFKQATSTTKENYGGTGLGLSISADYVKEMGGELKLESEVGKGSIFYFDLPLSIEAEQPKLQTLNDNSIFVSILFNRDNIPVVKTIARYFVKMGLDLHRINIARSVDKIPQETTHLIFFESQMQEGFAWKRLDGKEPKKMVVEENFLSLNQKFLNGASLISKYGFYGEKLYAFVSSKPPLRILIADDDKISLELIKTILQEKYCIIDTANSGQEALRKLKDALIQQKPYDIIFSDLNMPGINGVELIKKYRELEKKANKRLKAISISGDIDIESQKGVFDYFASKPFSRDEILSLVDKASN